MIKIEDTEVKTWDKHESVIVECGIKGNVFSCLRNEKTVFNSEIFKYEDLNVVVNREPRFDEFYYSVAIYNESQDKAWPLITIPTRFITSIKRLGKNLFVVWTDMPGSVSDIKQCTFCTIHDAEKQDYITIDFNILHSINFLPENHVLLCFSQILGGQHVEQKVITTLALHEASGKLVKTLYEFDVGDPKTYDFELAAQTQDLIIREKVKDKVKGETQISIGDLLAKKTTPETPES
jgi:hypothetical protein